MMEKGLKASWQSVELLMRGTYAGTDQAGGAWTCCQMKQYKRNPELFNLEYYLNAEVGCEMTLSKVRAVLLGLERSTVHVIARIPSLTHLASCIISRLARRHLELPEMRPSQ